MDPCKSHMEPKGPCENHMDPCQNVHGPGTWSTWRLISREAPCLPNSEIHTKFTCQSKNHMNPCQMNMDLCQSHMDLWLYTMN